MVHLGQLNGRPLTISIKPNCLTVSVENPDGTLVFSYDLAGRLWTALNHGISYRRGLDGKVVAKWQVSGIGRDRRWLSKEEARQVEETARTLANQLYDGLLSDQLNLTDPISQAAIASFYKAATFDAVRSASDIKQYHATYRTVGILPPDQYMAVVLQATEGCSFNTCSFCNFYRERPFRIKNPDDFRQHAVSVRNFLGDGISLRRTIFLGDANALVIPTSRLLPILEIVNQEFDVAGLEGIFAFLDGFSGEKKTPADYSQFSRLGLKRVYIGMESGSADLLTFIKKPGRPEDVVSAVQSIKAGGISVGVIILLGAGGAQYSRRHVEESITALNHMRLDKDDLLYFSELVENEGLDYTHDAYAAGLRPLSAKERLAQGDEIESRLTFDPERGFPPISRYDIREFVY